MAQPNKSVSVVRWVQHYSPKLDKCCRRYLRPSNDSWRVDETYIKVKRQWRYLYRAVDSVGNTLDFLLTGKRDALVGKTVFVQGSEGYSQPAATGDEG